MHQRLFKPHSAHHIADKLYCFRIVIEWSGIRKLNLWNALAQPDQQLAGKSHVTWNPTFYEKGSTVNDFVAKFK